MKRKVIIALSIVLLIINIILNNNFSYAKVRSNDPTVESGQEVNITISTTNAVSCFKIQLVDEGGLTFKSASKSSNFDNGSSNGFTINGATTGSPSTTLATYTFKAPEVTETKKFTVKFSVSGMDNEEDVQNTSTVTVKPKEQITQTSTTTNTEEPKFTETNKIMYATGDINLRASWSTSSSATQVKKGTELKVTATSTNTVNDYIWYRVNYNGEIKYVSSKLLTNTKPEGENEKSSNTNLKTLTIENQELSPVFSKDITKYTTEIGKDITKLDILAEAEDEKATVSIKGNEDLKDGENTITISVNAEDGTVKIYEIKVIKSEKEALGLKSLIIQNTNIANDFQTDIYEYSIDIEDIEELEIEAIANDENATVEILGNENLKDGENIITITVTNEEGIEKVTYLIKVNKQVVAITTTVQTSNNEQNPNSKLFVYITVGAILLIALIIIIVCIIKSRNKDEFNFDEYNNDFNTFPGELPQRQEYSQEEKKINLENEINEINNQIISNNIQEQKAQERKSQLDYFLNIEDGKSTSHRRGKHF